MRKIWFLISKIDSELEARLPYAYNTRLTTFEHQYLLKNKKGGDCQPVWWMCPKGNFEEDPHAKVPKYIHFPEEHLMLLKKAK